MSKLKKIEIVKIIRYTFKDDWIVEMQEMNEDNGQELWLQHKNYGIKNHMIGLLDTDPDEMVQYIATELPTAKEEYRKEYMNEEQKIDEYKELEL